MHIACVLTPTTRKYEDRSNIFPYCQQREEAINLSPKYLAKYFYKYLNILTSCPFAFSFHSGRDEEAQLFDQ